MVDFAKLLQERREAKTMTATQQTSPAPRRGSGMTVDWNKVPDFAGLISGTYNVRIEKLVESTTGNGKACWKGTFKVLPHANTKRMNNKLHINTFVIGSDDDPLAQDPDTIADAVGTGMMKHMFKAAGVKLESKIQLSARAAIGKTLTIVGNLPDKPSKGQSRAFFNVTEWMPLGKKEPQINIETANDDAEVAASNGRPRRGAPAAEPEAEEEGMEAAEEGAEPASDEPNGDEAAEEGNVEEPEEEPEPPKSTKGKGTKEATVTCGMCEKEIPRSLYKTHVPKCNS